MAQAVLPQRGATIYDVAQRAGVSIATVSRVLQGTHRGTETTRTKVERAASDLAYVPLAAARTLAVSRHDAYGLVLPHITGPYYADLLVGFEEQAAEHGSSAVVLIVDPKHDARSAVMGLASRVDGLTFVSTSAASSPLISELARSRPVVTVAGPQAPGADSLRAENRGAAVRLATHLIEHGRRRLLFVGDPEPSPDLRERYEGFLEAHELVGLAPADDALRVEAREHEGARIAPHLVEQVRAGAVDALVCGNDELAVSLISALSRSGVRVPDDVAVVGWDDIMTARYLTPSLTTVRQPVGDLGRLAALRLHQRLDGKAAENVDDILPTRIVLRRSCGCTDDPEPTQALPG